MLQIKKMARDLNFFLDCDEAQNLVLKGFNLVTKKGFQNGKFGVRPMP